MLRRPGLTASEQLREQRLIQLVKLRGVDPGQGRPAHGVDTQVVELSGLGSHITDPIPKAVATGQLSGGHGHKLGPARHLAQPATRMILMGQRLKLMSRNKFQHLRENRIMMRHGLNLLVVTGLADTSIVTTR